jgi:hypothetical protein
MAFRKETIKQQFGEALPAVLEPGEQVEAGFLTVSGPSPWLTAGLFGYLGMLATGARWYFVTLTDRRVIFMKVSMASGRPAGLAWTDPRTAVSLSDAKLDGSVWSRAKYQRPEAKPLRLNIQRFWREEAREFAERLGGGSIPRSPDQGTASEP